MSQLQAGIHELVTHESSTEEKVQDRFQADKVMCIVFSERKWMILLNFQEFKQTISSDCYAVMLTKLKARTSTVTSERQSFCSNTIRPVPTPV